MYFDGTVHVIEEEDQCYTCEHFLRGVRCPLLEALAFGVVTLDSDMVVRNCGFYKVFKRRLQLVDIPQEPSSPGDEERKSSNP